MEISVNLKIIISVIMFLVVVIYLYIISSKENYHLKAIKFTLDKGNRIIQNGGFGRGLCTQVNFDDYPELHEKAKEIDSFIHGEFSTRHGSCLNNAQLMQLVYEPVLNQAIAVYRCESNGVGEELKVSNYQDSCDYTEYLTKWNFPIGKYTKVPIP